MCVCVRVIVCVHVRVSGLAAVVPSVCHYNVDRTVAQVNYHSNRLITPIKHYWAYWGHWLLSTHRHTHTSDVCCSRYMMKDTKGVKKESMISGSIY